IPIPYPEISVSILNVTASNKPAKYTVSSSMSETTLHVAVSPSLHTVPLQLAYVVRGVYYQGNLRIRFRLSSYTTELAINILVENKTTWIDRRSLELDPPASKNTYFLIAEEAMPFAMSLTLSNLVPEVITLSLRTQVAPLRLENVPFYAMALSATPWGIVALCRMIELLLKKKKLGAVKIAYRNMVRRSARFFLTVLGVLIPSALLIVLLIQVKMAQQLLGVSGTSRVEWPLILVLVVAVVIGGFQVMNAVFSSVLERIREFGVMKAIGFRPSFIMKTVLAESVLIGLIAGFLGAVLGAGYLILSYNPLYGGSLPGDAVARIMTTTFGEVDIFRPLSFIENPWYRNYILASTVMVGVCFGPYWVTKSSGALIAAMALFFLLLRPVDPFLATLLMDMAFVLLGNILLATLFAVGLSILAGLYVARSAAKISTTEAMRHY
ncbi:MAG: ABC transporter permease, partial [Candidatus Bathyarchaeia archaeon]